MKPKLKNEIAINSWFFDRILFIDVTSKRASDWIEREAPQFGQFVNPNMGDGYPRDYTLTVSRNYDKGEVIQYLKHIPLED